MDQLAGAQRLSQSDIAAFYQRVVAPKVAAIEAKRSKAANAFWRRALGSVLLNAAMITFLVTDYMASAPFLGSKEDVGDIAANVMIVSIVLCTIFMCAPLNKFKNDTKGELMADIITIFPGFIYAAGQRMLESLLQKSGLFPSYDYDRGGDYIEGQYRDVAIHSANVELISETRDSKGRKQTHTVFQGPVYHLGFPRRFNGTTRVRRDGGWLGNTFGGWFAGLERVKLEDPHFENIFEVYSDNQVEARYILTTGFMELLLRVAARHKNRLEAAFFDQHVLIKVKGQAARLQITNPLRVIHWEREVTRLVEEFQDAFALVDELKLNQKIGL